MGAKYLSNESSTKMGLKTKIAIGAVIGGVIGATSHLITGTALGVNSTGPVAGGYFASNMGPGLKAGSWMAKAQSFCMSGPSWGAAAAGAATGGAAGSQS